MMYFDAIAKIVSERTGCDISAVKPESKFSERKVALRLKNTLEEYGISDIIDSTDAK